MDDLSSVLCWCIVSMILANVYITGWFGKWLIFTLLFNCWLCCYRYLFSKIKFLLIFFFSVALLLCVNGWSVKWLIWSVCDADLVCMILAKVYITGWSGKWLICRPATVCKWLICHMADLITVLCWSIVSMILAKVYITGWSGKWLICRPATVCL